MKTRYKDWDLIVNVIDDPCYGIGFKAVFYIPKTNGLKYHIQELLFFDISVIKTQKMMAEYAKSIIDNYERTQQRILRGCPKNENGTKGVFQDKEQGYTC